MRISKSAVVLSVIVAGLGVSGVATASATAPAPKAYGVCVNVKSGAMRLLEPLRLRRSQYGACRSTERKIYLPTKAAIPAVPTTSSLLPVKLQIKVGTAVTICAKVLDVAGVPAYECPVPSPTPSVSPAS